jgi:hypothetical protein
MIIEATFIGSDDHRGYMPAARYWLHIETDAVGNTQVEVIAPRHLGLREPVPLLYTSTVAFQADWKDIAIRDDPRHESQNNESPE